MRTATDSRVVRYANGSCSMGPVLLAWTSKGLCAALPGRDTDALLADLQRRLPRATLQPGSSIHLSAMLAALDAPDAALPFALDPQGTAFQVSVWQALRHIPTGQTRTYAQLAQAIGKPAALRAVGSACGANPIAVLVPCHRVLRSDGGLGGFHWGLALKQHLLQREAKT